MFIKEIIESAVDLGIRNCFQLVTSFSDKDSFWVNCPERNKDIDVILRLKKKLQQVYMEHKRGTRNDEEFRMDQKMPKLMYCVIDAFSRIKKPCVLGNRAICEKYGCHVFPSVLSTSEKLRRGMLLRRVETYWPKYH